MRCAIIPPEKLDIFTLSVGEDMRVEPVPFYSGPNKGSYAINEAILDSCPEWQAVADKARAFCAEHGVSIVGVDPKDLWNPNVIQP